MHILQGCALEAAQLSQQLIYYIFEVRLDSFRAEVVDYEPI
jgi:hypothetical protein